MTISHAAIAKNSIFAMMNDYPKSELIGTNLLKTIGVEWRSCDEILQDCLQSIA